MRPALLVCVLAVPVVLACTTPDPNAGVTVTPVLGNNQSGTIEAELFDTLTVKVTDAAGSAVPGQMVSWVVLSGGGSVTPATSVTRADGRASTTFVLGSLAGPQSVQASVGDATHNTTFDATGVAPIYQLIVLTPNYTTCLGVTTITSIKLLDAAGNGVPGKPVLWRVTAGTGVFDPARSDASIYVTGAAYGTYTTALRVETAHLTARVPGAPEIVGFDIPTVSPCPPHSERIAGMDQVAVSGTTLPAKLTARVWRDSGGSVAGAAVTWRVVTGGGSVSPVVSSTGADGRAQTTFTLGPAGGLQTVYAEVEGVSQPVSFDATALDPARQPVLVATVPMPSATTYHHDTFVRDGLAFVFAWNKGVLIYDVGNGMRSGSPSNPQLVSQVITSDNGVAGGPAVHNGWWFHNPVSHESRYLFIGQEGPLTIGASSSGDIHIVDVSNLAAPVEVGFIHVPGAGPHNFWMDEATQTLYAAYYNGGVIKVDVSGTLSGDMSGRIVRQVLPGGPGQTFTWGVMLAGGTLYAIDMLSGFWALDPVTLAVKGGANVSDASFGNRSSDLWVTGSFAYSGLYNRGRVSVWSLATNGVPVLAGEFSVPGGGRLSDVAVTPDGTMLVVTLENGSTNGVYVYDRADPFHPVLRGRALNTNGLHTVEVAVINGRTYAFVAQDPGSPRLLIYDITNVVP